MPKLISLNPLIPQPDLIAEAVQVIKGGGVVSFPTKYLYGLGADALNADAVDRIYEIKQRSYSKPILILIDQQKDLDLLVCRVPKTARQIMDSFWPGEITIVFEARDTLPPNLTAGTGKIGVRLPQHPVAVALTNAAQGPITATSANLAGRLGCSRTDDLDPLITDKIDLILDAGSLKGGSGSTIIDVTCNPPLILREGAVPSKDIFAIFNGS